MSILNKLASSLGRRDEVPNQELAQQIVNASNKKAVKELVDNLANKNKNIQSDCIKVLYEIGERKAALIADHCNEFIQLLESSNNRLAWGAMTALDSIAAIKPEMIYKNLDKIMSASDNGSVITKDHAIGILIKLAQNKSYKDDALTLLLNELRSCATNQLPMYAENSFSVIDNKYKTGFIKVLTSRLTDIEKDTKKKRVEKVIKKLQAIN